MNISTQQILKFLYVLSWIIFIGICIQAGGFIFNIFSTWVFKAADSHYFWKEVDLSNLYKFNHGYFLVQMLMISIVAILKACMFYLIVKLLHEKKLNLSQPFNKEMGRFIFSLSYLSFGIGLFSFWGAKYSRWYIAQGIKMPDIQEMNLDGADVWLFMGVVLFVIAQIFKRGIEIQEENELTV
jgi:hypothetical protein